jgi:hypothetical protein
MSRKTENKHTAFGRTTHEKFYKADVKENVQSQNFEEDSHYDSENLEKHKNFGKVPSYIEKYKEELKQAKDKKEEEKAKALMPVGTRLMTEEERIKTLEELTK